MGGEEKVNILLVDDQPGKLLGYEVILSELGENLIKAGSANEALEQLLKNDVAVVLIDVCMPDLDGFELAAMIREHPRFQKMAIIFVSAIQVTDLDLLRGYAAGAVDYVPVPVVPDLLRAKVRVFAELYRKTRQLETLNAELERRVAERTAELAQANSELEHRVEERTREREAALAQVHEMRKVESLGQLTGGVAHDFNNLLMAVLGNLELVRKFLPSDPKIRRLIDGAIQGAERGATLTKRMLAFARRQELKPETVDVPNLVDSMVEMLRRSLGPGIQIKTDFETDLPPTRVDPNQLELALLNLALNARDAMPLGGRLTISAHRERIGAGDVPGLQPGDYVCIAERDTGEGMDEVTLKRATEPFFTTKGAGRGTGLGLSMVDGLVAQSGGAMRITSQQGAGSTVELWLPVAEAEAIERPRPVAPQRVQESRCCRVLVIDDDPIVLAGTAAMLEDLGHTATEVDSAEQGLKILQSDASIDLVITDHAMPGMTGTELAKRIRRKWPELPVIIATGYAELPGELDPSVPRLSKPYRQQDLAAVVAQLVGEQPAAEPAALNAAVG
ncbi:MAG: hybrid sensor histidine kinase/response regulator [Alphaproteobacteria bacterium 13_1_20CM_3_64_12]|nr:MAG: hybrid sensor histidine kinase/response regulator [Alphaproteobacteria bacterium 13_1_20CM_3_64_12]